MMTIAEQHLEETRRKIEVELETCHKNGVPSSPRLWALIEEYAHWFTNVNS